MSLLDNASLVLTPNAYKEGKLYSVIPSDGSGDFTFTRATTATRVNSDGLVELVPYNLLQYSEQFDNVAWGKNALSITPNTTIAPNGTLTADTLSIGVDASSVRHRLSTNSVSSQVVGTIYTGTYYLKANQNQWVQILGNIGYSTGVWANFDLINGVIGNTGGVDTTASIESVGNGWYRCSVSGLSTGTSTTFFEVITTNNTNSGRYPSYQSLVAEDVCYAWGAQLVEGTNALPYQKTETRLNIPRLDYSLGGCPNILLEPQRTNLTPQSQDFTNGLWIKNGVTVSTTSELSPDGISTYFLCETNGLSSSNRLERIISVSPNTTYTLSIYVKSNSLNPTLNSGRINLVGVVQGVDFHTNFTATSSVQRITLTVTTSASETGLRVRIIRENTTALSVLAWGAQLEAGSYATSYIPTTSASVTRNLDVLSKTGISSLIGQTEGTMFIEMASLTNSVVSNYFSISDGTYANRASILFSSGTNFIRSFLRVNSISQFDLTASGLNITEMNKIAFAYRQNDFAMYVNGVLIGQSNTGDTFNPNTLSIVSFSEIGSSLGQLNARVNQATLYKERLTNDQLAQLTTI